MSVLINSNTGFWTWDTNWQTNNNIEFTPSFAYFEKDSVVVSLILADATTITVPASYYSISPSSPFKVIVNFLNFFNANGVASAATKAQVYIYREVPYSITLPPTGSITPEMLYNELYRFLALIFDATSGGANIIPPPAVRAYSDFSFDINGAPIANKNYALRRWAIDFPHKANTWVEYNGGLYKVKNDITINGATPNIDTTNYQCFIEPGGFIQKYNNLDRLIYSSSLTYLANETVVYNGHWWEATATVNNVTPGFGVSQWRKTTVGVWFATYNYLTNENTLGSNGMLYRAKQNNSGQDPTTDTSQTYWEPVGSSSQSSSNFFTDETFTGKATWTGTSTFVINTSSLLIGDNTEGKFTGVGYREVAITMPKAARGETCEISFDGYLGGTTPTVTLSLTDGAALPIAHNGNVISQLGKSRFFAKLIMTDNATLNFRLTFAGTSPDFRIQNLVVQREKTIYGAAIGTETSWTPTTQGLGTITGLYARWRQVGEKLRGFITFTTGTVTASEVQIGLPNNYTSASDYPTLQVVGHYTQNSAGANAGQVLIEASKGYITLGLQSGVGAGLSKILGSALSNTTTYSLEFEVTISQLVGKGIIQLAESAGPYTISNALFTTNANETTGTAYLGEDGSAINTAIATSAKYCDINLPRALLPNESYELLFQSAIDKEWIKAPIASVPSLSVASLSGPTLLNTTVSLRTVTVAKITASKLRVWWPRELVGATVADFPESGTSSSKTWANITGAADGFLRWKIKVGPNNAVELPPTVYAKYEKLSGGIADDSLSASDKVIDTHSFINGSKEWVVPMDGTYQFTMNGRASGPSQCGVSIFKNGTEIANVYNELNSTQGVSTFAIEQCNKNDLIKLTWHLTPFQRVRATIARIGPK